MSQDMMNRIKETIGCTDNRAKAILETLQDVGIGAPTVFYSAQKGDHTMIVETVDGHTYEVGIDKKHFVFSVMDMQTGEYLYMVVE